MNRTLEAIYENGVFRPLRPVALREHQRVTVTIPEEPATGAEVGPRPEGLPEASTEPLTPEQSEADARPWRGVFSPEQQPASLFASELEVRTADLPSWQPQVTINRRWVSDDEE